MSWWIAGLLDCKGVITYFEPLADDAFRRATRSGHCGPCFLDQLRCCWADLHGCTRQLENQKIASHSCPTLNHAQFAKHQYSQHPALHSRRATSVPLAAYFPCLPLQLPNMAPLILHNVPDEELYVGDDGIQRPYAMVFPQYIPEYSCTS
jgi:hypothetical protein